MAAVTICSDFGAQENKVYQCLYAHIFDNLGTQKWPKVHQLLGWNLQEVN